MNAKPVFIYAYTSLHPGTGQGVGVIDLPVAREAATGLPYLPGSSLKGVLRDRAHDKSSPSPNAAKIFGPEAASLDEANARAAAVMFSDQRLLLLPVRSLAGTMAWVTSPFVLQRFRRDCQRLGVDTPPAAPENPDAQTALVTSNPALVIAASHRSMVVLEDLDLNAQLDADENGSVAGWAAWLGQRLFADEPDWQASLAQRLCIVHDDVLSFLLDTATEIIARNQLTDQKTSGNLWYEEALPAESVLAGLVLAQQVGKDGLAPADVLTEVAALVAAPVQLGGHATIGRGICRVLIGG